LPEIIDEKGSENVTVSIDLLNQSNSQISIELDQENRIIKFEDIDKSSTILMKVTLTD
jgi:hypothetical protein